MLRKLLYASAITALLAGSAAAQDSVGIPLNINQRLTPADIERQKAEEDAYSKAIHKIPDKKISADPWGTIRPTSSTAAKTKQP